MGFNDKLEGLDHMHRNIPIYFRSELCTSIQGRTIDRKYKVVSWQDGSTNPSYDKFIHLSYLFP